MASQPRPHMVECYKSCYLHSVGAVGGPTTNHSPRVFPISRNHQIKVKRSGLSSSSSTVGRNLAAKMTSSDSGVNGSGCNPSPQRRLRHVDSLNILPSGAGRISHLNAVILGESIASEENDLVFPSQDFASQALVSSPQQVLLLIILVVFGFFSEFNLTFYFILFY